ncbi:MAG: YrvL family regulatory protein [Turicibacter sp.]
MKYLKDILGFSFVILILLVVVFVPFIGLLYFSGIEYASFSSVLMYIFLIFIVSIPIEAFEKLFHEQLTTATRLTAFQLTIIKHLIDFFSSLLVVHYVDEWMKTVSISSLGEIIFTVLIVLLSIFLDDAADDSPVDSAT